MSVRMMCAMPTPCVQTLKDPMSVGVREALKVTEETAQVNAAF